MKKLAFFVIFCMTLFAEAFAASALKTIDTPYTIMKVMTAKIKGSNKIIGSSYEGTIICVDYSGKLLWENKLSGFMNNDFYSYDIDGDGNDEILAGNADGYVYCIDDNGKLLWKYSHDIAPVYSLCAISDGSKSYVVYGGYNKMLTYLDAKSGEFVKSIHSSSYSIDKKTKSHSYNFVRNIKQGGKEKLFVLSVINTNWSKGEIYLFDALAEKPYSAFPVTSGSACIGTFAINDVKGGDDNEILMGGNSLSDFQIYVSNLAQKSTKLLDRRVKKTSIYAPNGYRMAFAEAIPSGKYTDYVLLNGDKLTVCSTNPNKETVVVESYDALNGMCKDGDNESLIFASEQSGGSSIFVLDYSKSGWYNKFSSIEPSGKMQKLIDNKNSLSKFLKSYEQPSYQRAPQPLYYIGGMSSVDAASNPLTRSLAKIAPNTPAFIDGAAVSKVKNVIPKATKGKKGKAPVSTKPKKVRANAEDYDRQDIDNDKVRKAVDKRPQRYLTQEEVLDCISASSKKAKHGTQLWVGHGSDAFYFSHDTKMKMVDAAHGKKMIHVYAEMESQGPEIGWIVENTLIPSAKKLREVKGNILLRNKQIFWNSTIYLPIWEPLVTGEYKDVFLASLEESNSKTMDMSVSGRMGLWAAGSMDAWSTRYTRDNPCYDRLRQLSYQRVPNPSLRMFIYHLANGATYVMDSSADKAYTSVLWELMAKGLLFIPKRDELVSINPVHLSVIDPDQRYLAQGVKDLLVFDAQEEEANKMVFSQYSGVWGGAPLREWDFTRYAIGSKERRLEFIPPFPHGMVLMTPPTKPELPRGDIKDHLHPIYRNHIKEFFTDGRNYYSDINKTKSFAADTYYKNVEAAIKEGEKVMPLTVSGRVGWAAAQNGKKHLRVTIIDGGYVNPDDRVAQVTFQSAKVKKVVDLVTNQDLTSKIKDGKLNVDVPCGFATFLEVELLEELVVK